jgi:tetratricopeptide (TPR) repeat protein
MSLKIKSLVTLFGIGLLCWQISFAQTQNLDEIRKTGFGYLQKGNWESAQKIFENALNIAPQDALSLYGNSLALFNLNRQREAGDLVEKATEILSKSKENDSLLADCLVLSAVISAVQNENLTAIEKLEKAVSLVPNHFDAHFSLGRAYFGNGEIDKSVNSFKKAVIIRPADARSYFFLATALERAGNNSEALAQYQKVLELSPNSADGNLGLAVLLLKTEGDKSEKGLAALQKAVALNPKLYEANITLGKTLIKINRANEAIAPLQKAAELAPNNPEPHFQLSIAYRKLGKKAEADAENAIVKKIHESRREVKSQNPPEEK